MKVLSSLTGAGLFKFCLLLLITVGVTVPSSGDHGLLAPKTLAFLLVAAVGAFYLLLNRRFSGGTQKLLSFFLLFLLFLGTWLILGFNNEEQAVGQFKVFMITLFVTVVTLFALEERLIAFSTLLKVVIFSNFTYSVIKVFLALLHTLGLFDLLGLMQGLGIRFMSMEIIGNLGRLQTSVDILTPFVLFFVLTDKAWGLFLPRLFKSSFVVFAWLSVALSFSRFLLVCALLAHVAFWFTENRKPLFISLSKFLVILCCLVGFVGPERVLAVIEKRFYSSNSLHSDEVRENQVNELMLGFNENPYLGKGMGGWAEKAVRDYKLKFTYEVQWVSFLMQFGLFGLLGLLLPLFLILARLLILPISRLQISLLAMFLLWLIAGFTNPFLISLTSGIVYALFYGAAKRQSDIVLQHARTYH